MIPSLNDASRRAFPLLLTAALLCQGCDSGTNKDDHAGHGHGPGEHGKAKPSSQRQGHGADPRQGRADDWCRGHGLPESQCTKCNPSLVAKYEASGDWCKGHGFPESVCPLCHPMKPPKGIAAPDTIESKKVRLRTPVAAEAAGIRTERAKSAALAIGIDCTAQIAFNQNRVADIRAPLPGIVRSIKVDLGKTVVAGETLFVLESARVGNLQGQLPAARQRLAVARANLERKRKLLAAKIATPRQLELARQELAAAKAQLGSLTAGLRIAGAPRGSRAAGRFALRTPIVGTVVRRGAIAGTFATAQTSLAMVADTKTMWAMLEVRESDAALVRVGQQAVLKVDGLPRDHAPIKAKVTWIASEVSKRTHTVAARAEVQNAQGLLRSGQFAHATIHVASQRDAVAVPRRAVQRIEGKHYVFVREGPGLYSPRKVTLGRAGHGLMEVKGKVALGAPVVTDGAFLLRTELSKHQIGAGCCEVPGGEKSGGR